MRLANSEDLETVQGIYHAAVTEEISFGLLNWPNPFTKVDASELIEGGDLYCFEDTIGLTGLGIISQQRDDNALYLDKFVRASRVRNRGYFGGNMIPEIFETFPEVTTIKVMCPSNNPRLKNFLESLGFVNVQNELILPEESIGKSNETEFKLVGKP